MIPCLLAFGSTVLCSCGRTLSYEPYAYDALVTEPIAAVTKDGYYRPSEYQSLSAKDVPSIGPTLSDVYSYGDARYVVPSLGEASITVIPVTFADYPSAEANENGLVALNEVFFGDKAGNQYYSLAEFYDRSSFHRFHVKGKVVPHYFQSPDSYATLETKRNAAQTKNALVKLYASAIAWHNALPDIESELQMGDPVYFVYFAPYSGMNGGQSQRSSMMWAFALNDPAPLGWTSYYMVNGGDNRLDAHTLIHEFGHMLGLKDYYDTDANSSLAPISPLGRMDMMDCSLGDHASFSKMLLGWTNPFVATGPCEISLRPSQGNGDCVLLSADWNGTPFDEYILLEYYTPSYLNATDASLHDESGFSLMNKAGIKAYHVDARLGLYGDRAKAPLGYLSEETALGVNGLDFHNENTGTVSGEKISRGSGFLIQLLDASSSSGELVKYYVASDHNEDRESGGETIRFRDCLFQKGQGICGENFADLKLDNGKELPLGFEVVSITPTEAKIRIVERNAK